MVLAVILFFGQAVLGGTIRQCVPAETRQRRSFLGAVIVACLGYEILVFHVPFRAAGLELIYATFGALAVVLIMIAAPIQDEAPAIGPKLGCLPIIAVLFLPIVMFTSFGRVVQAQRIAESYDGVVSQKYHSHNHNAPSLVVRRPNASTTTIENVDTAAWDAAVEDRSRVRKPAWSVFGELDGKRVRLVPEGRVMFLGPFPD